MSRKKGLHFFTFKFDKGVDWYKKKFIEATNGKYKAIGEASPTYIYYENAPERIYSIIPNAKLIFILRNPVDRANSHYWMNFERLRIGCFEEELKYEDRIIKNCDKKTKRQISYKDRGKYSIQIKRFMEIFPDDQMLFIKFESFIEDPQSNLKRIYEFLGVNTTFDNNPTIHANKSGKPYSLKLHKYIRKMPRIGRRLIKINIQQGYPLMNHETRKMLIEYFKPYNKDLEQMLGMKFEWDK